MRFSVHTRAQAEGVHLEAAAALSKAEGVAFALRNASDYFQIKEGRNVSQRILNLYYGSLAFAYAEMLASPAGPVTLANIEESTKQGHGLYTVDGPDDSLEHLIVGIISSGFFSVWMASLGLPIDTIPSKKARRYGELASYPETSWISLERLFASIPEMSDLFYDIFDGKPNWGEAHL